MMNVFELGDTTTSDTRGTGATSYALEPRMWLKKLLEAAKQNLFFDSVFQQHNLPNGTRDLSVPYRQAFLQTVTGVTPAGLDDTTTEGGAMTFTDLNNLDGIVIQPTNHAYGIAISNKAVRDNAVNLLTAARDELSYGHALTVDSSLVSALNSATAATSVARGMQTIFGGDATTTASLASGDVITTDLWAKAKRFLSSKSCYYSSSAVSSEQKNPWHSTPGEPFVGFIAPEQEYAFLTDSQFVNAAEYGGQEVLLNGEIGKYVGVKMVTTDVTPNYTNWGGASLAGHSCFMVKSKVCGAVAFSQTPKLHIVPFPSELETRIILETDYNSSALHSDSIVRMQVSDD